MIESLAYQIFDQKTKPTETKIQNNFRHLKKEQEKLNEIKGKSQQVKKYFTNASRAERFSIFPFIKKDRLRNLRGRFRL